MFPISHYSWAYLAWLWILPLPQFPLLPHLIKLHMEFSESGLVTSPSKYNKSSTQPTATNPSKGLLQGLS